MKKMSLLLLVQLCLLSSCDFGTPKSGGVQSVPGDGGGSCTSNWEALRLAGRELLTDVQDEIPANSRFVMIRKYRDETGQSVFETCGVNSDRVVVPEPLGTLDWNYIMVFKNYIRVETGGGMIGHKGFFIGSEECPVPVAGEEIIPGLWLYGAPEVEPSTGSRLRRLDDIRLSTELTREDVIRLWGPPDGERGFGVEYMVYSLEDGRQLWLLFASHGHQPLLKAFAGNGDFEFETLFDGMDETEWR